MGGLQGIFNNDVKVVALNKIFWEDNYPEVNHREVNDDSNPECVTATILIAVNYEDLAGAR